MLKHWTLTVKVYRLCTYSCELCELRALTISAWRSSASCRLSRSEIVKVWSFSVFSLRSSRSPCASILARTWNKKLKIQIKLDSRSNQYKKTSNLRLFRPRRQVSVWLQPFRPLRNVLLCRLRRSWSLAIFRFLTGAWHFRPSFDCCARWRERSESLARLVRERHPDEGWFWKKICNKIRNLIFTKNNQSCDSDVSAIFLELTGVDWFCGAIL